MITTDKLAIYGQSQAAGLVLDNCNAFIKEAHDKHLKRLKVLFKDGKTDHMTLLSEVSAMCALDDLKADLLRMIKLGNAAYADLNSMRKE